MKKPHPSLPITAAICEVLFPGAAQASIIFDPDLLLLRKTGRQLAC